MSRRNMSVGRWMCLLAICWLTGTTVASCGGGSDTSVFQGDSGADGTNVGSDDGSTGKHDGPTLIGGDDSSTGDGGNPQCHPIKTCPNGQNCGQAADGCGGTINCGANGGTMCPNPSTEGCGCGGKNKCGLCATGDSGNTCTPATACPAGEDCGFEADGCGGIIKCGPADGGSACGPTEYCGGGGFNKCGGSTGLTPDGGVPCTPSTTCSNGQDCGVQGDGCGGVIMCGQCTAPAYCGGGGFNICGGNNGLNPDGAPNCTPTTCAKLGFDCGPAGDGCGGLLQCGSCTSPQICGGGGIPSTCGNSLCTGLCQQQVGCDGGTQTTITGKVIAGTIPMFGTPDPVPNVLVYVANGPIQPFPPGVQCSQCGSNVSGNPLVQTTTAYDGTFTLANVPATNVPPNNPLHLVIQLGYWRREFFFNNVPACTTTAIGNLVMPQTQAQGDIPLTAISTGSVDSLECVLLKMGIDQSEFTTPANGGRVHMYEGNGASLTGGTPAETALMANGGSYMNYDQIIFPCWGVDPVSSASNRKSAAELGNLVSYANAGGHFFATHYSFAWEYQNAPFNTVVKWHVDADSANGPDPFTVQLPPTNPKGTVFSNWLHLVGAMPNPQTVQIAYPRHDVDSVTAQSVDWIDGKIPGDTSNMIAHFTFDTPVGAQTQCGHAIYSDFHVANAATSSATIFPSECMKNETTGVTCSNAAPCPMTAQEKILEYMIWDLSSCVGPQTPPTCTPITCQDQNINCGPAGDGCGNELMCGTCTPPQTCGGGGVPGQCGAPPGGNCTPMTCQQQNINCGPAGDGCGNEIMCGTCTPPQTCGGGGKPGQCGYPDGGQCQPATCSSQGIFCGPAGDGCGNEIMCGTCTPPLTCGGGGVPGQCGAPDGGSCLPTSCAQQGIQCGTASDGCGNVLDCGSCQQGQTCGGQGCTPGHCCISNQ